MNRVILNAKRDYATVHHHPWIFSGAIRNVEGSPAMGDTGTVSDIVEADVFKQLRLYRDQGRD